MYAAVTAFGHGNFASKIRPRVNAYQLGQGIALGILGPIFLVGLGLISLVGAILLPIGSIGYLPIRFLWDLFRR